MNTTSLSADAGGSTEALVVERQIPGIGFDRLTMNGDSATLKHSRGLCNINKISNWTENRLDLFRTSYLAVQKDRLPTTLLGMVLLLWGCIGYFAVTHCEKGMAVVALVGAAMTGIGYVLYTTEAILFATKKTPLDGCDISYDPGSGNRSQIIQAYIRAIYGLFYGGVSPPDAPEKSYSKNVLAWNILPKGKDVIDIHPGHIMIEQTRRFLGIGPATSTTFVTPMKNVQWLHFASTVRTTTSSV